MIDCYAMMGCTQTVHNIYYAFAVSHRAIICHE
jgi:hypothetical protein